MPNWKKLITSGSDAVLNSLYVTGSVTGSSFTGSFTGSLFGSSSYALTASYALNAAANSYTHVQGSPSTTWTINHNLNNSYPVVTVYNNSGFVIIPQNIQTVTANQTVVTFAIATSGNATVAVSGVTTTTASFAQTAISSSYAQTASLLLGSVQSAISASYAATASYVNTLNQNVLITGSLTVGAATLGSSENTLTLGPRGTNEGGQLMLQAGTSYTSASMLDIYTDTGTNTQYLRILRGSNAGSDAVVSQYNLQTKQLFLPAYNSLGAFSGTPVAALGVNSSGDVITIQTGSQAGGSGVTINNNTDNYLLTATGTVNTINGEANLQFNGSTLSVTGNITATSITSSGAFIAQANNAMYFRGGDDAEFWDVNIVNTVGIYGQQDQTVGGIKLGSGGGTITGKSGNIGVNNTNPTQGTLDIVGNVYATSFTGSLFGTSSWAQNVVSSSYAGTASILLGSVQNATSASYAATSSWALNFMTSSVTSASFASTSSWALNFITSSVTSASFASTSSWALNFMTSSVTSASFASTSSWALNFITSSVTSASYAATSSWALNFITGSVTSASFAATSSWANNFLTSSVTSASFASTASAVNSLNQNVLITGSLFVSSSIVLTTSGSIRVPSGSITALSITGSLFGTASWATNFTTSSVTTASYAATASNLAGGVRYYIPIWSGSTQLTGSNIYQSGSFTGIRDASPLDPNNPDILLVQGSGSSTYNIISAHGDKNGYVQTNIQNFNTGINASSDVVATADNGTESSYYIDMGINGSQYTNTGLVGAANDAYIYSTGNDLYIGNATANHKVVIFNGGFDTNANSKIYIHPEGVMSINTNTFNTTNPAALTVAPTDNTTNNLIQATANVDNYTQASIGNQSTGTTASADFVAYNDIDTANQGAGYIDMGINSTTYVYNGTYPGSSGDAYLFTDSDHLLLGSISQSSAAKITIFAGGVSEATNAKLIIFGGNNHQMTGSLNASQGFTGSLFGTSSWAQNSISSSYAGTASVLLGSVQNATSASYAATASLALNGGVTKIVAGTNVTISPTNGLGDVTINASAGAAFPYTGSALITGSLIITGSTASSFGFTGSLQGTASFATSASYAVSASWAPTGNSGLTTKSGVVLNTAFSGNPDIASIVFSTPFANTSYAVTITGEDARSWTIQSKATTGFTINSNSSQAITGNTYWIAVAYGES